MHHEVEKRMSYKVCYKQNSAYSGSFQTPIKRGVAGLFGDAEGGLTGAQEGAAKARDWFNNEDKLVEVKNGDGKTEIVTTKHDNVILWIEVYEDGNFTGKEIDPWTGKEIVENASPKENAPKKQPAMA